MEYLKNTILGDFSIPQLDAMRVWDFFNVDLDTDEVSIDRGIAVRSLYLWELVRELYKCVGLDYTVEPPKPNSVWDGYLKYVFGLRSPSTVLGMVEGHMERCFYMCDKSRVDEHRGRDAYARPKADLEPVISGVSDTIWSGLKVATNADSVLRLCVVWGMRGVGGYANTVWHEFVPGWPRGVDSGSEYRDTAVGNIATLQSVGFDKVGIINLLAGSGAKFFDKDFIGVCNLFKAAYGFERVAVFSSGATVICEDGFEEACKANGIYVVGSKFREEKYDADTVVSDIKVSVATGGSYAVFEDSFMAGMKCSQSPLSRKHGIGVLCGSEAFEKFFVGWGVSNVTAYNRHLARVMLRNRLFDEDVKGLCAIEAKALDGSTVYLIPGVGVYRHLGDYYKFADDLLYCNGEERGEYIPFGDKQNEGGAFYCPLDDSWKDDSWNMYKYELFSAWGGKSISWGHIWGTVMREIKGAKAFMF